MEDAGVPPFAEVGTPTPELFRLASSQLSTSDVRGDTKEFGALPFELTTAMNQLREQGYTQVTMGNNASAEALEKVSQTNADPESNPDLNLSPNTDPDPPYRPHPCTPALPHSRIHVPRSLLPPFLNPLGRADAPRAP